MRTKPAVRPPLQEAAARPIPPAAGSPKKKRSARLALEQLEERWVPASVRLTSGYLIIGPSTGEAALRLTVTQSATTANTFTVKDGASILGSYAGVANINITGGNGADSVTVDLNGKTYTGSLLASTGNGNDTIDVRGNGGALRGNITLLPGLGNDSVSLNRNSTGSITVGGSIQVTAPGGHDSISFGNTMAVSKFLGTVSLTGMNVIRVGPVGLVGGLPAPSATQPDFFGGDFNASLGSGGGVLDLEQDRPNTGPFFSANPITIAGSLRLTGGPGDDEVILGAMNIGKDMAVNWGGSQTSFGNDVEIAAHESGVTTIGGNFSYTGQGVNFLDLANTDFQGNVSLNLGNGSDSVLLDQPYDAARSGGVFNVQTVIGGNLTIVKGDGDLTFVAPSLSPPAPGIEAQIGGNVLIDLGNGNSTISFLSASSVGGTLTLRTGNGNNLLDLEGPQSYNVNAIFGSGNDTVTLNNPSAILNGYLDGGGGVNTFNQVSGQLGNLTLLNF